MLNNMQADDFISLDVDTSCAVREVFPSGEWLISTSQSSFASTLQLAQYAD